MAAIAPADVRETMEAVAQAAADGRRLEVRGGGSKAAFGAGPRQAAEALDMSRLARIIDYDPQELILTAEAGVRLSELEPLLAAQRQMLAFEPPNLGALLGAEGHGATLGGTLAANLAGPRRLSAGAARDHFLGFEGVSGRGLAFKAGGKVVKNVTGFDLPKLMAGAWGGLAVLTTVTVKIVPRPRATATVLLLGVGVVQAVQAMSAALRLPAEVSGAAHLPDLGGQSVTALRLEGFPPSVAARTERLKAALKQTGEIVVTPLAGLPGSLWRIVVPPASGAALVGEVARDGHWLLDWGGGLLWLNLPEPRADAVRTAAARLGGHAILVRSDLPASAPAFHPEAAPVAALSVRVRTAFDPAGVLLDRRSATA
jgi:glycolate oxidase FAD binding subunit